MAVPEGAATVAAPAMAAPQSGGGLMAGLSRLGSTGQQLLGANKSFSDLTGMNVLGSILKPPGMSQAPQMPPMHLGIQEGSQPNMIPYQTTVDPMAWQRAFAVMGS
jgi:hypothetical protein